MKIHELANAVLKKHGYNIVISGSYFIDNIDLDVDVIPVKNEILNDFNSDDCRLLYDRHFYFTYADLLRNNYSEIVLGISNTKQDLVCLYSDYKESLNYESYFDSVGISSKFNSSGSDDLYFVMYKRPICYQIRFFINHRVKNI